MFAFVRLRLLANGTAGRNRAEKPTWTKGPSLSTLLPRGCLAMIARHDRLRRGRCWLAILYSLALHGALAALLVLTVPEAWHPSREAPSVIAVSLITPESREGNAQPRSAAAVDLTTDAPATPEVISSRKLTADSASLPSLPRLAALSSAKFLSMPHTRTRTQRSPQQLSGRYGGRTSSGVFSDPYKALLERKIQADLHYPWSAREMGQQGTTLIRVRIRRNGIIEGVALVHSSGSTVLDNEARRVFRRIGKLPALPRNFSPEISTLEFLVPIRFQLFDSS